MFSGRIMIGLCWHYDTLFDGHGNHRGSSKRFARDCFRSLTDFDFILIGFAAYGLRDAINASFAANRSQFPGRAYHLPIPIWRGKKRSHPPVCVYSSSPLESRKCKHYRHPSASEMINTPRLLAERVAKLSSVIQIMHFAPTLGLGWLVAGILSPAGHSHYFRIITTELIVCFPSPCYFPLLGAKGQIFPFICCASVTER